MINQRRDKVLDISNNAKGVRSGWFTNEVNEYENILKTVRDYANGNPDLPTYVNGIQAGTGFGVNYTVATEVPVQATKGNMGLPLKGLSYNVGGSAYLQITPNETTIELGTGTDPNAFFEVWSNRRIRYEAGSPSYEKVTIAFVDPTITNGDIDFMFGLWDGSDGFGIKQEIRNNVSSFYFELWKDGVVHLKNPVNGNFDDFDITDLKIFKMLYGYLGIEPTDILIKNTSKRIFEEFHYQEYNQRVTSVKVPELPIGGYIRNLGNTVDVTARTGSIQVGVIDGASSSQKQDPNAREKVVTFTHTVIASTEDPIIAFKNSANVSMYRRIDATGIPTTDTFKNVVSSDLDLVSFSVDTNKVVKVNLWATPESNVTGIFTPVELGWSVLQVATDSIAIADRSKLELLKSFDVGKVGNSVFGITKEFLLPEGFTAVFECECEGIGELKGTIEYKDLL